MAILTMISPRQTPGFSAGQVDFVDTVHRQLHPGFYWGLVGTWVGLSLWVIWEALATLLETPLVAM